MKKIFLLALLSLSVSPILAQTQSFYKTSLDCITLNDRLVNSADTINENNNYTTSTKYTLSLNSNEKIGSSLSGSVCKNVNTKNYVITLIDSDNAPVSKMGDNIIIGRPSKSGYKFKGWSNGHTNLGPSERIFAPETTQTDITLTALWEQDLVKKTENKEDTGGDNFQYRDRVSLIWTFSEPVKVTNANCEVWNSSSEQEYEKSYIYFDGEKVATGWEGMNVSGASWSGERWVRKIELVGQNTVNKKNIKGSITYYGKP